MTKAEKKFNELLPQYLEAYEAANGKSFPRKIAFQHGYVKEIQPRGFVVRVTKFEKMLDNLKKGN